MSHKHEWVLHKIMGIQMWACKDAIQSPSSTALPKCLEDPRPLGAGARYMNATEALGAENARSAAEWLEEGPRLCAVMCAKLRAYADKLEGK